MPASFTLDDEPANETGTQSDAPVTPESAEILGAMPDPQQHAIDTATAERGGEVADAGEKDSAGFAWNPSQHATGADGKGVRTAKGTWRKKRGVAKHASTLGVSVSAAPSIEAAQQRDAVRAQCRAAGGAAASSVFMIGRIFGGEEWAPTEPEVTMQTDAWAAYFEAKGITDFPPGLALTIAVAGYAGPRFFLPKTRERVGGIKHWFSIRVAKWRVKRALKTRGIVADVTIKGTKVADVYDNILIDGLPFNQYDELRKPRK